MTAQRTDPTEGEATVLYEKHGAVAKVTLNRPHVLNALDSKTHTALAEIWDDFEADDRLRVAVLSGAGDRAFSVGQDLKEYGAGLQTGATPPTTLGSSDRPGWPRLTERFDLTKPVIAKVRGYALGGGFELALACDLIVAADNAEFALPEPRLGLIAGAGGVLRLSRQLPLKVAMGHLLTGRRMDSSRAYELGLVNEVVPEAELDAHTESWVRDVLRCSPLAVRAIKEVALSSAHLPLEKAFAGSYEWERRRANSRDAEEGTLAFLEKREPRWTGD